MNVRAATAGVFVVALLPRLYAAIAWAREPVWDGHYYDIGARSIAAGLGYVGQSGGAWCHYPVGYSGILGVAYAVFGAGRFTGPLLNALLGALLAAVTFRLARHATGDRRAAVAGLIVALYPGLIAYTPLLMAAMNGHGDVVGALLLESSTPSLLLATERLLGRTVFTSLIALVVIGLALALFASALSLRIRCLLSSSNALAWATRCQGCSLSTHSSALMIGRRLPNRSTRHHRWTGHHRHHRQRAQRQSTPRR